MLTPIHRWLPILVLGILLKTTVSPSAAEPPPGPESSAAGRAMVTFLAREAQRLESQALSGVTNREQWQAIRPQLYKEYMDALGLWPLPERTPLQAAVTGTLVRPEGFRVENVHFQSSPHLYVTGNLYLPADAKPGSNLPAVLYVCGHAGHGRDGGKVAFQQHGMWFATHGFACLIIDTLQLGEISGTHHGTYRYDRWWWQSRGYSPAAIECWNGIRALDYLQERPEIDRDRLAVTGISGGGAATFWIAAADERVKVAVPVSGMSDLPDYVGGKVVNGHCDCMFLLNSFQWPWTHIAALVAPRPLLFANSGHDTLFPMNGNDRLRTRLESLYGCFTNRTDGLFDIGVVPGGHEDKVELRLMAYRWISRHLRGDDSPVTEPVLPRIAPEQLRAFPGALPADEWNTTIDQRFIPKASPVRVDSASSFRRWQSETLAAMHRRPLRSIQPQSIPANRLPWDWKHPAAGTLETESPVTIAWHFFPAKAGRANGILWIAIANEGDTLTEKPPWGEAVFGEDAVLHLAPRGSGAETWKDPHPYYIRRSLPLLGRTVDSCRVTDVVSVIEWIRGATRSGKLDLRIAGRGKAGLLGLAAGLMQPQLTTLALVEPPLSFEEGPILPGMTRVVDLPDAYGLAAPRTVQIWTKDTAPYSRTADWMRLGGGKLQVEHLP